MRYIIVLVLFIIISSPVIAQNLHLSCTSKHGIPKNNQPILCKILELQKRIGPEKKYTNDQLEQDGWLRLNSTSQDRFYTYIKQVKG